MTESILKEFLKNHSAGINNGIEESSVNGYTVKYFIEDGNIVGGMIMLSDEEVCMVTAEGFVVGELPDSFELTC